MRTLLIKLLVERGLTDAAGQERLTHHLLSSNFTAIVDSLGIDPAELLQARSAAWRIEPIRVSWLARAVSGVNVDEETCRRLGAVPVQDKPLTLAFADPEAAYAAHAVLPPHAACLATVEDIERLRAAVFGPQPRAIEDDLAGSWLSVIQTVRSPTPLVFRPPPWAAVDK